MNLRKSIKRRTFYDDRDYHDPNLSGCILPAAPKPVKLAYKGKVVEFNPQLRPAVFPTISLGQVVEEPTIKEPRPPESSESSTSNPKTQPSTLSTTFHNQVQAVDPLHDRPDSGDSAFDVSNMYTSLDKAMWSRRLTMSLGQTPSPTREMSSNGPENPVFAHNMKLMDKWSKRTDEDWAAVEMETSDEDEDVGPRARRLAELSNPTWEHLPLALQLDLIDTVGEGYQNLDEAFKALRLKPRQRAAMHEQLRKRHQYLDAEESVIDSLHRMAEYKLLTGSKKEVDRFINGGYQRQMKKQLFIADGEIDYLTATGRDMALAKVYLKTCGIRPEVLNHWTSVLNDGGDRERRIESIETPGSPTPAPRSRLLPDSNADARSPTPPSLPPVNLYRKPRPPNKATRRRSRPSQAQDMPAVPGTQGEATPVEKGGPANALKSPKEAELDSVQPNAKASEPPSKESYQIPPLAVPFSLPPQLSTQRQAWLPDAPPANREPKGPNNKQNVTRKGDPAPPLQSIGIQSVIQDPTKDPSATVHGHRAPLALKNVRDPNKTNLSSHVGYSHDPNTRFSPSSREKDMQKVTAAHKHPQHEVAAEGAPTPRSPTGESRSIREGRESVLPEGGEMSQDFPKRSGSMVPIKRPATSNVAYGVVRGTNPAGFQYPGQPSLVRSRAPTTKSSSSNTQQLPSSMAGSPKFDAGYQVKEHTNVLGKRPAQLEHSGGGDGLAKNRKTLVKGGSRRQTSQA